MSSGRRAERLTADAVRNRKGRTPLVMATAYDHAMARILDEAGIDIVLVGDSYAMVGLGLPDTLGVGLEEMIPVTAAVSRACRHSLVVADMPFLSYQTDRRTARLNAGLLVKKGGADAVKIEAGRLADIAEIVSAIVEMDIPVMGHVGLTPQSVKRMGGFRVQGRTASEALRILHQAETLEKAGAFCLVLEGVPAEVAKTVTERLSIPTIGIGAGPHCDGQVQVLHDLLGLLDGPMPRHAKPYARLRQTCLRAVRRFADDVRHRRFPGRRHTFRMPPQELPLFLKGLRHEDRPDRPCAPQDPPVPLL